MSNSTPHTIHRIYSSSATTSDRCVPLHAELYYDDFTLPAQQAYSLYVGASPQNKRNIVRPLFSNCTLTDTTLCPTYRKLYQLLLEALQTKETGRYLDEYRTFCASPQAELALQILEAFPILAA